MEQQNTARDACRWDSDQQYFPEDVVAYCESLFKTKGSRSVKEIGRRYTSVLCDARVASMRRDKHLTREYWYCKYTHTRFFDAHAETRDNQSYTSLSLCEGESESTSTSKRTLAPSDVHAVFSDWNASKRDALHRITVHS